MRNIILAAVAVLVIGGGAAYYFTAGGGKNETALTFVRSFLDAQNVRYETLALDGDVVRATNLTWTPNEAAAPVTAESLEIEGLSPTGLASANLPGGNLKTIVDRATAQNVRFDGPQQSFVFETIELREFRGRDLNGFRRASNDDQSPRDVIRRILSDVAFEQFAIENVHVEGENGLEFDASRFAIDAYGDRYDASALSPIVDRIGLEDLDVTSAYGTFAIGLFELAELKGRDWIGLVERLEAMSEEMSSEEAAPEIVEQWIGAVAFERFAFENVSLEGVRTPDMPSGQEFDLALELFALEDLTPGQLGAERIENLSVTTALGGGALGSFRIDNVDYRWLPELLSIFPAAAETGEAPALSKEERDALELRLASAAETFVMEDLEINVMGMRFAMPTYVVDIDDSDAPSVRSQSSIAVSFGPTNAPLLPPPFRLLAERGVETLQLSVEGDTRQDLVADTLESDRPISIQFPPLAEAKMEISLANYDPFASLGEVASPNAPNPAAPYQNAQLASFALDLDDSGLLDWLIEASALQQGIQPDQMRSTLIQQAQTSLAPSVAEPLAAFFSEGGQLSVRLAPPSPTSFEALAGALQQPESFGLTITRE